MSKVAWNFSNHMSREVRTGEFTESLSLVSTAPKRLRVKQSQTGNDWGPGERGTSPVPVATLPISCRDTLTQTGRPPNRLCVSEFWKARHPRPRCWPIQFLVRVLSLALDSLLFFILINFLFSFLAAQHVGRFVGHLTP